MKKRMVSILLGCVLFVNCISPAFATYQDESEHATFSHPEDIITFEHNNHLYELIFDENNVSYQYCDDELQAKVWISDGNIYEQNYLTGKLTSTNVATDRSLHSTSSCQVFSSGALNGVRLSNVAMLHLTHVLTSGIGHFYVYISCVQTGTDNTTYDMYAAEKTLIGWAVSIALSMFVPEFLVVTFLQKLITYGVLGIVGSIVVPAGLSAVWPSLSAIRTNYSMTLDGTNAATHTKVQANYFINDTVHDEHFGEEYSEGYAPQRLGDSLFAQEIAFDVYGWSAGEYNIIGWTFNP